MELTGVEQHFINSAKHGDFDTVQRLLRDCRILLSRRSKSKLVDTELHAQDDRFYDVEELEIFGSLGAVAAAVASCMRQLSILWKLVAVGVSLDERLLIQEEVRNSMYIRSGFDPTYPRFSGSLRAFVVLMLPGLTHMRRLVPSGIDLQEEVSVWQQDLGGGDAPGEGWEECFINQSVPLGACALLVAAAHREFETVGYFLECSKLDLEIRIHCYRIWPWFFGCLHRAQFETLDVNIGFDDMYEHVFVDGQPFEPCGEEPFDYHCCLPSHSSMRKLLLNIFLHFSMRWCACFDGKDIDGRCRTLAQGDQKALPKINSDVRALQQFIHVLVKFPSTRLLQDMIDLDVTKFKEMKCTLRRMKDHPYASDPMGFRIALDRWILTGVLCESSIAYMLYRTLESKFAGAANDIGKFLLCTWPHCERSISKLPNIALPLPSFTVLRHRYLESEQEKAGALMFKRARCTALLERLRTHPKPLFRIDDWPVLDAPRVPPKSGRTFRRKSHRKNWQAMSGQANRVETKMKDAAVQCELIKQDEVAKLQQQLTNEKLRLLKVKGKLTSMRRNAEFASGCSDSSDFFSAEESDVSGPEKEEKEEESSGREKESGTDMEPSVSDTSSSADNTIAIGDVAFITDLANDKAKHLNGCYGKLETFDAANSRFGVRLSDNRMVAIKNVNLKKSHVW